jgi:uncharacterized membrane protein
MNNFIIILFCGIYAVLNVSGAALIKSEIPFHNLNGAFGYLKFLLTTRVILGFGIIALSALVMFKALSLGKFSYVVPLSTGINFTLTVILGVFLFGDKLSIFSVLGLVLILTGIIFMSIKAV